MAKGNFYDEKLNWLSSGYFALPTPSDYQFRNEDIDAEIWRQLEYTVDLAKGGNFDALPTIVDLCQQPHQLLRFTCCKFLGDAGTDSCFNNLIELMMSKADPDMSFDFLHAFHERGKISDVYLMLDILDKFYDFDSAKIIPIFISDLLEAEWGYLAEFPPEDKFSQYEQVVVERCDRLRQVSQCDDPFIRNGELFSVNGIAKNILQRTNLNHENAVYHYKSRRLFEASTGINCSSFYLDGHYQPERAAELVNNYLSSGQSEKFQEGMRYFFGFQIPR